MSNSPVHGGSFYSTIGFKYDPSGYQAYINTLRQLNTAQQQQSQQQQQVAARQQAATGTTRSLATAQEQLRRAELGVALASTDQAGRIRLLEGNLQRLTARTKEAGLAQDEYTRRATAAARAEQQLIQARNVQARGLGPALPRTLVGVGGAAAAQLGVATSVDALTGKIVALGQQSVQLANRAEGIGTAYERATARAGIGADQLLAQLRDVSRGTISDTDLMLNANRALALGVGRNVEDLTTLLTLARERGKEMGITTAEAFDRIVLGLGKAEPELLDELGILIDANKTYKEYASSINVAADSLTKAQKVQAITNDLIAKNRDLLNEAGNAALSNAEKLAAAEVTRQNALARIGQRLQGPATTGAGATAALFDIASGNLELANLQRGFAQAGRELFDAMKGGIGPGEALAGVFRGLALAEQDAIKAEQQHIVSLGDERTQIVHQIREVKALADARKTAAAAALARVGETFDRGSQAQTRRDVTNLRTDEARLAEQARAEALRASQGNLAQVLIQGADELIRVETRRDDELERLRDDHNKAIDRLNDERGDIEQENVDRLAAYGAQIRQRDARALEDQRIADRRDEEDWLDERSADLARFQEDRARDTAKFNDSHATAEAQYRERRGELIQAQQAADVRREQQYQRELVTATREGQLAQFRSTTSFLTQLYGLTRGRRRKGLLEEGRAALTAAQAEAAALAQTDPAAAAQLLAERQRQFIEGLETQGQAAQLRRDARRGGPLAAGAVEDEIRGIADARAQENQLAIDAIKAGARERAEARERERTETAANNQKQLDQLDASYQEAHDAAVAAHKAQVAEEDRAFKERQAQEADNRAELLQERQEDRELDARRQAEDDAASLAALEQANQDRLDAVDEQIKAENTAYNEAHATALANFDTFKRELLAKIEDAKKALLMTPTEADKAALKDAAGVLGGIFGDAYIADIQRRIAAADWRALMAGAAQASAAGNAPSGALSGLIRNFNPADDPRPTAGALAALFGPNARITSTYDSTRPVGQGVSQPGHLDAHGGLDITLDKGSRVPAPMGLQILKVSADQFAGGTTVLALDRQGHQWVFAHMHGVPAFKPGQWIAKGTTLGFIGAEGHVHVQERQRNDASIPIDPTAHLMAAASPLAAVAPRRAGGVLDDSGTVSAQAMRNYQLYGGTAASAARGAGGVLSLTTPVVNVNLQGAQFGTDFNRAQAEQMISQAVIAGFQAYTTNTAQQTTQLGNAGTLR